MTRRRFSVIAGGIAVLFAFASVAMAQDDGGRSSRRGGGPGGGPGGGRGGFGGGFGGRGGFGGFGGGSLLSLAGNSAVQEELKLTDDQKAKIEKLSQESRAKRDKTMQEMRDRMNRNGGGGRTRGGNGNQGSALPAPATTGLIQRVSYQPQDGGYGGFGGGFGGAGGAAGGFGGNPYTGGQQGVDPAVQQQMMLRQQQQMQNARDQAQRQRGFDQMRQTMEKLTKEDEAALAKILKPDQIKRLKQISLQLQGPFAILRDQDLAQKLNVTEEQYVSIQDIEEKSREQGNGTRDQMRALMDKVRASMPQDANNNENGNNAGGNNANANNNNGRGGNNNGGRGGNNANNNNGGRGNRGNFNPEAFRAAMEKPEIQAEMGKIREAENAQRDRNFSRVFAALDRRQSSMYKAMLGDKIDPNIINRGFFGRGGPGGPNANAAPNANSNANAAPVPAPKAETAATKADAPKAAPTTAKADAAKAEPAPKAATANSNSLRARRGIGASKPQ